MTEHTTTPPMRISGRTLNEIRQSLKALPPKPKETHSAREMVEALKAEILDATARGYTLVDIAEHCSRLGARISSATLASYLRDLKTDDKKKTRQGAGKAKRAPMQERTVGTSRAATPGGVTVDVTRTGEER